MANAIRATLTLYEVRYDLAQMAEQDDLLEIVREGREAIARIHPFLFPNAHVKIAL